MELTTEQILPAHAALLPPRSISTYEECVAAVKRVGMVWPFTPAKAVMPAIFPALATESEQQRWDWMWGWKDRAPASRELFYGKVVFDKPTLVSLDLLIVMYALSGNTGDWEDDLERLAADHLVPELAIKVCRHLTEHGPTDTRTLQKQLTDDSRPMRKSMDQALLFMDRMLIITKSGAKGGNSLSNMWSLLSVHLPGVVDAGTEIPTREAAPRLLRHYFGLTPAIGEKQFYRLFPWNEALQRNAIARLLEAGELRPCKFDGKPGIMRADFVIG